MSGIINPDVSATPDLWPQSESVLGLPTTRVASIGLGPPAIAAQGLTKRFGSKLAVDDVTLAVAPGEIFGFLGPNGAGKTTTIKMLVGLLKPSAGRAFIGGYDVHTEPLPAKARVGYAPDQPVLPDKLTPHEYLDYVAGLYQLPRAAARRRGDELLAAFDLAERAEDLIEGFSHGMKQKTALTGALLHGPAALFLDEPTVGLDPKSARLIKDLLRQLADQGMAVFMSTHILEIAERMCDRVGIIQGGRLIAAGTLAELRAGRAVGESLEDIFLQLTGSQEQGEVLAELTDDPDAAGASAAEE